jgi:exopolysaccharide production protein ExoQ
MIAIAQGSQQGRRRDPASNPGFASRLLAITILAYAAGAFQPLIRPEIQTRPEGDAVTQMLWIPAYIIAGIMVARSRRQKHYGWAEIAVGVFLSFAMLSILWSEAPNITARRAAALAGTCLCGYFLASCFSTVQVLALFRTATVIAAVASITYWVIAPGDAIDPTHGTLRGVFIHKNVLARMMILGLAAEILLTLHERRRRYAMHVAVCALLFVVMVASGSATALAALGPVTATVLIAKWTASPAHRMTAVAALLIVAALVVSAFSYGSVVDRALGALDRDVTLTSRTKIWAAVGDAIRERPITGYGYGAFWRGNQGASGTVMRRTDMNRSVVHAHNGFLEVWLQLGIVGVLIAMLILVLGLARGLYLVVAGEEGLCGVMIVGFVVLLILYNIGESSLFSQNSIMTILLSFVMFSGSRALGVGSGSEQVDD